MAFNTSTDAVIKVLLIGDSGVGKSSLLHSFTTERFSENIGTTIGIDFKVKRLDILDEKTGQRRSVKMQIWDTAGQERFRTLTNSYYRGAQAIVLVYDVNLPSSFHGLTKWLEEAKKWSQSEDIVFLLIGNKIDLCSSEESMPVPRSSAESFARRHHIPFAFTSAKTRVGFSEVFNELAQKAYDRFSQKSQDDNSASQNLRSGAFSNNSQSSCC